MRGLLSRSLLLVATVVAGCASPPPASPAVPITILHTNDHHGRFWRNRDGEAGLAARKAIVDATRAELRQQGGHVVLLDAGDVNTGTPESDSQDAEPDFRGMSMLAYDAMAVGNHEFDRPAAVQRRQQREWSAFPWLSANLSQDGHQAFEPYRVLQLGGVRLAVFGLTTEETAQLDVERRYPGLRIEPAIGAARALVPRLRAQADIVVALTHLGHYTGGRRDGGVPGDVELARSVGGIDIVVGGHTHSLVCMLQENVRVEVYEPEGACAPDRQNGAWIVQAGDRGRFIGRADFIWQAGRLELKQYRLLPVNLKGGRTVSEDAGVLRSLESYQQRGEAWLGQPVGRAQGRFDGERDSVRRRQTNLGQLLTQAMREAGSADLAVISGGGIRASLPDGAITMRDVLTALPFGNRLVVVTLSGAELAEYIATVATKAPGTGAYAQWGALSFRFEDRSVRDLRIQGAAVESARSYRLAVPSFLAAGGDGYPDLRSHPSYIDTGLTDSEWLRRFLSQRGTVDAAAFAPR